MPGSVFGVRITAGGGRSLECLSSSGRRAEQMTRKALTGIFWVAVLLMLVGITRGIIGSSKEDEPRYDLDCAHRRIEPTGAAGHVLRIALVQMAVAAHTEAVLDAVEIPLLPGREFVAGFGCQTSSVPQTTRFSSTFHVGPSTSRRNLRARRLPDGFAGISLDVELEGIYHGVWEGLHLLSLEDFDGERYKYGPGYRSGGSCHLPVHAAAMRENVPIARVYPDKGLAFFAIVTPARSDVVAEPGRLQVWREVFSELDQLEPVPDRAAIDEAVANLGPRLEREERTGNDFLAYGPLVDLLGAALVLRDHEASALVQERLAAQPGLLDSIREAGLPPPRSHVSRWFIEKAGAEWFDCVTGWMVDPEKLPPYSYFPPTHVRILDLTDEPAVAAACVDRLEPLLRHSGVREYVLSLDRLGRTEEVQAEFSRLRLMVMQGLSAPWSVALRSPVLLWGYSLLVPLLALLLVVGIRSNADLRPDFPSRGLLVLLAVGSQVPPA